MQVAARALWLGESLATDVVVDVDDRVRAVRPWRPGDPPLREGLVVPGLVNAHAHLELRPLAGTVPGGDGLVAWVRTLAAVRAGPSKPKGPALRAAAADLVSFGTAYVSDVCNEGGTPVALLSAGLSAVVQHELLTLDRARLPDRLTQARSVGARFESGLGTVLVRAAAHGVHSTAPALLEAALTADSPVPGSIHVAEDLAELQLLRDGTGPFAEFLDELGLDWRWWVPPGCGPVTALSRLGLLGPRVLLVHGVHLDDSELALAASARSPLALCPRSNLHIGGRLPRVPELLAAGVRLCLGTDSEASSPDLDVLGEIPPLASAFPGLAPETWLRLATAGGADALGLSWLGRVAPGTAPGLLWLPEVSSPTDLSLAAPRRREWLIRPGKGEPCVP